MMCVPLCVFQHERYSRFNKFNSSSERSGHNYTHAHLITFLFIPLAYNKAISFTRKFFSVSVIASIGCYNR